MGAACEPVARDPVGPLELLVVQPTPFCNLDCSYCYLPDRANTRRMPLDTLEQVFRWVFSSGLVREPFTLLWHAGEPLVVPVAWYEAAAALLRRHSKNHTPVTLNIKTKTTQINNKISNFNRSNEN